VNFFHSGDLGDVIYALPAMRALGGGSLYLESRPWTARMTRSRVDLLHSLFELQPYIDKVRHAEPPRGAVDFSTFRQGGLLYGVSLAELQANWVGAVDWSPAPWLSIGQPPTPGGRVVCHRSPRYHNPYFRWDLVGQYFGARLFFVGLPQEVVALRTETGVNAEHLITDDYYELAEIISGSHIFIGNQSSPMALALAMGHYVVQETCLWTPDCVLPRDNVRYIVDGGVAEWGIPPFIPPIDLDRNSTPAGGWTVASTKTGAEDSFKFFKQAVRYLRITDGLTAQAAEYEVDRQTAERCPWKVRRDSTHEIFGKVLAAVDRAATV
jgi:hypothetical protein